MESDSTQPRRYALRSATRVKSACPYCFREVYVSELRQHLSTCGSYQAAQQETYPEEVSVDQSSFGQLPVSPSSSRTSSVESPDDSDEERKACRNHFMARFLRLNHSTDVEPGAPRQSRSPEPQVYPLRPKSGKPNTTLCPVCFFDYNRKPRTPLVLPSCGHTVCAECVKKIFAETKVLKCPVCRSRSHQAIAGLPVNFALLEIAENSGKKEACPKHGMEIVAFCKDHEVLLCGICIFEHKDHKSFLLTSPEAAELANTKKAQLDNYEQALESAKSLWQTTVTELNELSRSLNSSMEKHSKGLNQSEERLVRQVKSGKTACITKLRGLETQCNASGLRKNCAETIQRVTQDLQKLKDSKAKFDSLPVAEQLAAALAFRAENYPQPPSLEPVKKLEEQLKQTVNYEEAVRSGSILNG